MIPVHEHEETLMTDVRSAGAGVDVVLHHQRLVFVAVQQFEALAGLGSLQTGSVQHDDQALRVIART